jgi:large subunit ribosomal protein L24
MSPTLTRSISIATPRLCPLSLVRLNALKPAGEPSCCLCGCCSVLSAPMSARRPLTAGRVAVLRRQEWKARVRTPLHPHQWKLSRGDTVQLLHGPDKGKQGVIREVVRRLDSVIVSGVNIKKRVVSASPAATGFVAQHPGLLHLSNVALLDPVHNKPTSVSLAYNAAGVRVRVSRASGAELQRPRSAAQRAAGAPPSPPPAARRGRAVNAATDTEPQRVTERTFVPPDHAAVSAFLVQQRAQPPPAQLQRHFPARLPRLPPFPYVRASLLVGQHAAVKAKQGAPPGIEYIAKH